MNLLYCGDKNIENGLIISVLSFLKQVQEPLHIYILTMQLNTATKNYEPLSQELADYLAERVQQVHKDSTVLLLDAGEPFKREMPTVNLTTRFTPYCMLRLYADQFEQLPDKLLYVDYDVVCRRNCSELYHQDIEDFEIGGVLDHYGKWFFRNKKLRANYLNSGVLVLNLKKCRETGLLKKCRVCCRDQKMFMPDQSALNKLAMAKKILPRRYNEQRKLKKNTVLQHFSTSFRFFPWPHILTVKPWQIDKMHGLLNLHEYDDLLVEYNNLLIELKD